AGAGNVTGYLETPASDPVQKIRPPLYAGLPERRLDDWHQHKLRSGGQILLHTAHARGVPLSQRFPSLDGPIVYFVVDEGTPSCVKRFPISRHHHHHIRWNAGTRLCMFGTQFRTAEDGRSGHLKAAGDQECRCSSDHPSEKASPVTRHILFQPPVQTVAEPQGHFEHPFVAVELNHIARSVEHSCAVLAATKMLFHSSAQARIDFTFEIVRNLPPHIFAADYHGFVPLTKSSLLLQLPPSPGASRSRSISRARSKRVLTDAVEIPRALAVSSMLRCCISRRTKISRYFSPSAASASASFSRTSLRSRVSKGISRQSAKSRGV